MGRIFMRVATDLYFAQSRLKSMDRSISTEGVALVKKVRKSLTDMKLFRHFMKDSLVNGFFYFEKCSRKKRSCYKDLHI